MAHLHCRIRIPIPFSDSDCKPNGHTVLCRTFHTAQTKIQIPIPGMGLELGSESVSAFVNVNNPLQRPRPIQWLQYPMAWHQCSSAVWPPPHNSIQAIFYRSRYRFRSLLVWTFLDCLITLPDSDKDTDLDSDSKPYSYIVLCRCPHCMDSDLDPYSLFLHNTESESESLPVSENGNLIKPQVLFYVSIISF